MRRRVSEILVRAGWIVALALGPCRAIAADGPLGDWLTASNDAHVRIAPCAETPDRLCGTIVWLAAPKTDAGEVKVDRNNPDPNLQTRPIIGTRILSGMQADGPNAWDGGTIYDPSVGKSYRSNMKLGAPGQLLVEGCILLFCRQQVWRRVGS